MIKRFLRSDLCSASPRRHSLATAPVLASAGSAGSKPGELGSQLQLAAATSGRALASPGPTKGTVLVLDDDPRILKSLSAWLQVEGYAVQTHTAAAELFQSLRADGPACLLLDLELGDTDGYAVLAELKRKKIKLPTIILTGHGHAAAVVKAMRQGACDFLTKPHDPHELLVAIGQALEQSRRDHDVTEASLIRQRVGTLTERERAILTLVLRGRLNKQVADELGIALVTVKLHRGRAMRKLGIKTAAELGRIANDVRLDELPPP